MPAVHGETMPRVARPVHTPRRAASVRGVRTIALFIVMTLGAAACGKKEGAPPPSTGSGSGSATATATPPTTPPPAPAVDAAPAGPKTCADGDAAACVAEANAIAPQGAYRAKLSKEEADAKVAATLKPATRACELNNGEGCALVARYGAFGDSDKMLERACELGYVASCGSVGRQLADGGKKENRARAAELLEKACDANVMDWMSLTAHKGGFCRQLQKFYAETVKDKAKAKSAHDRACAQGDKLGCACKEDADCGEVPDDQSGTYTCSDGACDIMGG